MSGNPRRRPPRPSGRVAAGEAISLSARPPRASPCRGSTFGLRGMPEVEHVPEQLLDVTITPEFDVSCSSLAYLFKPQFSVRTTSEYP